MAEERVQRQLAAIMAADVVGYSRLMGADEAATLAALKAHRKELVDTKIAEHQGRIVKLTGDGMLVEFTSVVNAVACAAEIQRKMRERNADVPEERRIEFRIGINLGDIIVDENDIYRRRRQRRGAARKHRQARWHLGLAVSPRAYRQSAGHRVRGHRGTSSEEHRTAGAGLSRDARTVDTMAAIGTRR